MENINILEELFDRKKISIIKLFLRNKEEEFYLREVSRLTKIPPATTFRILRELVRLNIIKEMSVKTSKLYVLNMNKNVEYLDSILKEERRIIDQFVDEARYLSGIEMIVQHGEEREDKANILIIGKDVDPDEIKKICGDIKAAYGFSIHSLTLTLDQFEQMSSMGLYQGHKVVLFKRRIE